MEKYGIEAVRGGSFCKLVLTPAEKHVITMMINGSSQNCFLCGKKDHFSKYCPDKKKYRNNVKVNDKDNDVLIQILEIVKDLKLSLQKNNRRRICFRCGRYGHYTKKCYAKTHKNGNKLKIQQKVNNNELNKKPDKKIMPKLEEKQKS